MRGTPCRHADDESSLHPGTGENEADRPRAVRGCCATMKPVLILQHLTQDGPAYLQTWLQRAGVSAVIVNSEAGEAFPDSVDAYAALAVLGGEMSANDDLPSLRQAERLILEAISANRPVLGHC